MSVNIKELIDTLTREVLDERAKKKNPDFSTLIGWKIKLHMIEKLKKEHEEIK